MSSVKSRLEGLSSRSCSSYSTFAVLQRWSVIFSHPSPRLKKKKKILFVLRSLGCRSVFKRRRRRCLMVFRVGWFPVRHCALAGCCVADSWGSLMPRAARPARFSGLTWISRCAVASVFNNAVYSLETCKAARGWVYFSAERKHIDNVLYMW